MERLDKMGITAIAATTESKEDAAEMASKAGVSYPVAYGVTEEDVVALGAWWTEDAAHGRYLQPMEFIIIRGGVVFNSLYASGPIGRMAVDEATLYIRHREQTRVRRQQAAG